MNVLTEKFGPLPGWAWGAVAAGGVVLYRLYKARQSGGSSPTSMTVAAQPAPTEPTATLTTPGGFSYSGPLSGLQSAIPQGALSATAGSAPSSQAATPSEVFNPYPVGTIVTGAGEKIVQAIPTQSGGYVDVTNMGGLYTTNQVPSGSAYSGQAGNYSAAVQGNNIYEYTPTGVQQFTLK